MDKYKPTLLILYCDVCTAHSSGVRVVAYDSCIAGSRALTMWPVQ